MGLNNRQSEREQKRRRDIELAITLLILIVGRTRGSLPRRIPTRGRQAALRRLNVSTRRTGRGLGQQLADGTITVAQWFIAMEEMITASTIASGAIWDGIGNLTNAEFEILDRAVQKELDFLRTFRGQIESGAPNASPGNIINRSGNYAGGVRGTYYEVASFNLEEGGFTEERNILFPGDSCTASRLPGCVEVTSLGWQPVGSLPRITDRTCRSNDRCQLRYRNPETGEEVQP